MSDERRREPRLAADAVQLRAISAIDDSEFGSVVNVSSQGMMLITSHEVDSGGVLQLLLYMAGMPDFEPLNVGVEIAWCSEAETAGSYWVGAQIIDISEKDDVQFQKLVRQCARKIAG